MAHRIHISQADANRRLNRFLFAYLREAPQPLLHKLLRKKRIKLNGHRAEGGETLTTGDFIDLYLAPETLAKLRGERSPPARAAALTGIVYEDAALLMINKPAGLPAHGGHLATEGAHLLSRILWYLYERGAYDPEAAFTPALCNRLDTNTSGLTVCGKTLHALQTYTAAFAGGKFEKEYLAVVEGKLGGEATLEGHYEKNEATNTANIIPLPAEEPAIDGMSHPGYKHAVTAYISLAVGKSHSLLLVRPRTGRSHQIRAHLAGIGHPLAGDKKYGGQPTPYAPAQLLHAYRLTLNDPGAPTASMTWAAPPPQGFLHCVRDWFGDEGIILATPKP
ncbi:MAG: RluA family pseudouridine synthase [Defluviitaleaceae bacterium]|nr:RluA family pseudouridine synthase [Defluviitaleaceae bacterium]MCL2239674.1 RluA family pseudouridine synthase [Defluviitaleaceae bacterium]